MRIACLTLLLGAIQIPQGSDCDALEYRRLDFWVGKWDVFYEDGRMAGTSEVQKTLQGRVIMKNGTGIDGFEGKSFNLYDRVRKRWIQKWVDSRGQLIEFQGAWKADTLEYIGRFSSNGQEVLASMAFTPHARGSFKQVWRKSADGGKTWAVEFTGICKRAEPEAFACQDSVGLRAGE